jgi:transketolase
MSWTPALKEDLKEIAKTIRHLSIDAVEKANSGHPGLPLGCAEIGAYLYGYLLRHNPKNSKWINRDRFILSAGHGSMLLYSCLHLAGFKLPLQEIKNFRQLHSQTPGHPESFETDGVEATTGPLGQGFGNAVGHAIGLKILQTNFGKELFDAKVYCLAGDGCIMEGVTSEVSSYAGHLGLDNLVIIYDANKVSLDGPLSDSCSEDTALRYKAYGWDVYEVDGHDLDALHKTFQEVNKDQKRPVIVIAKTVIGKGSPHREGTYKVHGSPLGKEEAKLTKEALGITGEDFYIAPKVSSYFEKKLVHDQEREDSWKKKFGDWAEAHPVLRKKLGDMLQRQVPDDLQAKLMGMTVPASISTRKASQEILNVLGAELPYLYGGSADLSGSDMTWMKPFPAIQKGHFEGRNFKFGVREFGMATIASGLYETQAFVPYIGTFLTFSDYMRNAIRLMALMKGRVIYHFTHDSVFLGEDGPTHQPIEQLASLRAIPNLHVIRPADHHELVGGWLSALTYQGPTAFSLSRQNLPTLKETTPEGVFKGGYVLKKEIVPHVFTLIATGSEVSLALETAVLLEEKGKGTRVVSLPCFERFNEQSASYRNEVLGKAKRVSIEAATTFGWAQYIGLDGIAIGIDSFGISAPDKEIAKVFGFTKEAIAERLLKS